jgi:hypothetical protein
MATKDHRFVKLQHPGYDALPKKDPEKTREDFQALIDSLRHDKSSLRNNTIAAALTGREFGRFAGEFLICFTDMMRFNNLISKHFEFAAAGCLVLTSNQQLPVLEAVGFIDRVNFVAYDRADPEPTVSWALDPANRHTVDRIRRAGYDLARTRHYSHHRSAMLDAFARQEVATTAGLCRGAAQHKDCKTLPMFRVKDEWQATANPCPLAKENLRTCTELWKTVTFQTGWNRTGMV